MPLSTKLKGANTRTIALGLGAAFVMWGVSKYMFGTQIHGLRAIDQARELGKVSLRYPQLEPGAAAALEGDSILGDFADRLQPFASYDTEIFDAFLKNIAALAEFQLECAENSSNRFKKGRLQLFHEHVTSIQTQLRFLRRQIFTGNPGALEDFDAIAKEEFGKYAKDEHHNMWCESSL
jgi:hypothetical protein